MNGDGSIGWGQLFVLHWWNYFVVKLLLSLPILFLTFTHLLLNIEIDYQIEAFSLLIDILAIYIIPIVFISHQKWPSIPLGLKCLFGNFRFSLPLVLLSISPILLALIPINSIILSINPTYRVLSFLPQWSFTVLIDFAVFITASLIIKDKLYQE
jgi:hypothetical protein